MTDELPPGWALVTVGDVAHFVRGVTYSKEHARNAPAQDLVPVLRATNIGDGLNYDDLVYVPNRFVSEEQIVLDGDIVLAMSSGSKSVVGKAAIAKTPIKCGFGAFCGVIRPSKAISHSLLSYYFQTKAYRNAVSDVSKGSNINNLKAEHVLCRPLPIPPRPEQVQIASRIDELFSRIDEGERALERVQKLVERYRQSVLKAAVTGELTRDWREKNKTKLESGEALLARILKARRAAWEKAELDKMKAKGITPTNDKWKQKYEEPSAPNTDDLPELPEGWVWTSVEQLCFVDTGATPKRGTDRFFKHGTIDWITSAAVNEPVIRSAAERITLAAIRETNTKVFPVGSLIVAMYGEGKTRGKVAELGIPAATNQACAALLCGHLDPVVKSYVRTFFEKNYAALRTEAAGGVQPNLNLGIIKGTALPLPPLAEMAVIGEVVATRLSQVAAFASEFSTWDRQSVALRQKILAHAFAGAIVHQDPADEPATLLLERIATERDGAPASSKRGRKPKTQEPA